MGHRNFDVIGACAVIVLAGFGAATTWAQEQMDSTAKAEFEVASIKPNRSGGGHHSNFGHGRFIAVNISAKELIKQAYGITDYQLSGAPDWTSSDAYDINAKMEDATAVAIAKLSAEDRREEFRQLFQSLLEQPCKSSLD